MIKKISIVVPVFNEEENVLLLHEKITEVCSELEYDYEVIYVDDGSSDTSAELLNGIVDGGDTHTHVVEFARNFGQTAAIAAGIDRSEGDVVILMDADLQNDPVDIPMLLDKINEGYDVVSGWRKNRQDTWLSRKLPSQMANALISKVTGVKLHDYGCTLKAYRREVIKGFKLYGEMHRFIPAYAKNVGAKITELPVNHHPRIHGVSKYGIIRTFKVVLDLFTVTFLHRYATKPIYFFGSAAFILVFLSVVVFGFLVWDKIANDASFVRSPLLLLSAMSFLLGIFSMFFGLIAELLVRTYYESQAKATYVLKQLRKKKPTS
jgi:glycosyltransferase involved in cell wall biosynthesis